MGSSAIVKLSSSLLLDLALYQKFAASGKLHCGFGGQRAEFLLGAPAAPFPLITTPG